MRRFADARTLLYCALFAFLGITTALTAAEEPHISASPARLTNGDAVRAKLAQTYGDLPLSFEANQGQADGRVRFLSRGNGYTFFLTASEAVLAFSPESKPGSDSQNAQPVVLRMQLAGANPGASISGLDQLPGSSNYFFGKDPSQWHTGVPTFRKVAYQGVYPGINLVYYGNQRQLEYDFVVTPGADPSAIKLAVDGALKLAVQADGSLVLHSASGDVTLLAPRIYQQAEQDTKREIAGRWTLAGNTASFLVAAYDRTKALVIDPVLTYSSFLGGSQKNTVNRIVVDAAGNAYVAGFTAPGDFAAAPTPLAMSFGGGAASRGAFVAKIDPTGSNLLYSTYLSGSAEEEATGLAVDATGNVYVTGYTHSPDFPVLNAYQSTCHVSAAGACANAFLTKISPAGNALVYSTYLGGSGSDAAKSLAVDANGSAYVVGTTSSTDFPATTGAAQAKCGGACAQNAFVTKFDPTGTRLSYATYLGGSASDSGADIALDASGNAYITGQALSADFPLAGAFQKSCTLDATSSSGACVGTAFVTKVKADGSALLYSTYIGGNLGSTGSGIAVDALGSAYITGSTQSADFPVLNALQKTCSLDATSGACSVDIFLTKFAASGKTLVYSTYLGGTGHDEASAVAVDASGRAHVTGYTESADFPTVGAVQPHLKGASDAFVARFNVAGNALEFSTYHGGTSTESGSAIALDAKGNAYLAGQTSSADFPTSHAFQSSCVGACTSAFVSKMTLPQANSAPTITSANNTTFTVGTLGTFTVTTAGTPTPTTDDGGATLPTGVTYTDNGDGTGTLTGTPAAGTGGAYPITFTATNGVAPDATQSFTLTVNQAPAITSGAATTFTVGTAGTFTVTATGFPAPTLSETGTLPTGVTFNTGTGVLSGTPAAGTGGTYSISFTAHNAAPPDATQTFTLTVNQAPAITSAASTSFTVGSAGTFTVTATGFPAPALSETGALPTGVTFNTGTGVLSGTPATGTGGSYPITFTAHNTTSPDATQNFTLTVNQGPVFTSGAATTFTVGTAGTFTVTATGTPAPTLSETGTLPTGVTFNTGTGVLSGTPAAGTGGTYSISFKATNTAGNTTQTFTLTVDEAPSITSASSATFIVAAAGTFTVTTKGFPLPALTETGGLPTGVTFVDNGDGTATLAGTPATGTAGPYALNIKASNTVSNVTQPFTLGVIQIPTISSTNATTFTVGTAGTFTVTTTGTPTASIAETGGLPGGVTFVDNGNGTGTLAGTAAAGTGGTYAISFKATNTAGSASQSFTLTVNEAASITSTNTTTFTAGTAGTFTVTTRGFPKPSLSETGGLPTGVTFVDNGNGTATLAGTPGATTGGNYALTLTAHNGIGTDGSQSFTLAVHQPSAITSTSSTSCQIGVACTFAVTTTGVPTPTLSETGTLPGGITFVDNGNGTATLGGTAVVGSGGVFALSIKATNTAASATQSFTLTIADFSLALASGSAASSTAIQGQSALPLPTLALTSQNSYTGTVALTCPGAGLPSGAACSFNAASNPLAANATVNSAATITTATNMPVGNYSVTFQGTDAGGDFHTISYPFSVECMFSITNATYAPQTTSNPASFGFTVNETAGGSNCPWTAAATGSSVTVTAGSTGTDTAVGTGATVAFQVATNSSESTQSGTITATYFGGTSAVLVSSEPSVTAANTISGSSVTVNATASQTAANATIQFTGACGAVNASNSVDPTNNNFGITCSAPTTALSSTGNTTVAITITIPTGATAELRSIPGPHTLAAFYLFGLGVPGIVFVGLGTTAFGSGRKRFARRGWTRVLSILMVVILLALLASCSGGFNAMVVPKGTANAFTVTVMGVVTDSTGNVIGVEIFTIAVPVTPQV